MKWNLHGARQTQTSMEFGLGLVLGRVGEYFFDSYSTWAVLFLAISFLHSIQLEYNLHYLILQLDCL